MMGATWQEDAVETTHRSEARLAMGPSVRSRLFAPADERRLAELVEVGPDVVDGFAGHDLERVEVLVTGWGCPRIDAAVLERAPALRAVVHTAGSVKHHLTAACWERGIVVSSAVDDNAVPVAEYTLAAILFAQKRVLETRALYRERRAESDWEAHFASMGNYERVVGIVGASRIGRRVLQLLQPFDFELLVSDPLLDPGQARDLGAALVDLDELVGRSDTVSLHAPSLPETRHLMDARRLALMRDGATLVNTARGDLVDTEALTAELVSGRVHAVLDVTTPEVLPKTSPLYDLPNVLLTPHVAGSLGNELRRLTRHALDELARFVAGEPFEHPVRAEDLATSA